MLINFGQLVKSNEVVLSYSTLFYIRLSYPITSPNTSPAPTYINADPRIYSKLGQLNINFTYLDERPT